MILPFFRRAERPGGTISTLYGMIVAQARLACFYRDYAVPDTINGRFDLIVLHLALVLDRLAQDSAMQALSQGVFDRFCRDMDGNLREMGIADLKVPKEMQRIGEAFYGRAQAYRTALASPGDAAPIEGLRRNIYGGGKAAAATRLAAYVREAVGELAAQGSAKFAAGKLSFPDPARTPAPGR
jgi:cytochrome b pre-mRNA-processing protein 3